MLTTYLIVGNIYYTAELPNNGPISAPAEVLSLILNEAQVGQKTVNQQILERTRTNATWFITASWVEKPWDMTQKYANKLLSSLVTCLSDSTKGTCPFWQESAVPNKDIINYYRRSANLPSDLNYFSSLSCSILCCLLLPISHRLEMKLGSRMDKIGSYFLPRILISPVWIIIIVSHWEEESYLTLSLLIPIEKQLICCKV